MKKASRPAAQSPMSADAYAGFLKLWLTPASQLPRPSADVDAYIRYANEREPLSEAAYRAIGQDTPQAA